MRERAYKKAFAFMAAVSFVIMYYIIIRTYLSIDFQKFLVNCMDLLFFVFFDKSRLRETFEKVPPSSSTKFLSRA